MVEGGRETGLQSVMESEGSLFKSVCVFFDLTEQILQSEEKSYRD